MTETLYKRLKRYSESDYYGFHMPGHKRNKDLIKADIPYAYDITEITGFDDLHHAKEILKDEQERAARIFHAEETAFLVNGSTVGILSAILGSTQKGDRILVSRNCHKSVYHAIYMNELYAEYLYPEYDSEVELNGAVDPELVRKKLEENAQSDCEEKIKAVMIVSPTYDGVLSDIEKIAEIVHEYHIPLIVDEAHGAHFGFHPYFPKNANEKGADIVIQSVHKTLPSLTQTALLHMNGEYADRESVRMYLHMLQSSSPSYILMAAIDECIDMLENNCKEVFQSYVELLENIRKKLQRLKHLQLVEAGNVEYDKSKLVISVKHVGMSGKELHQILLEKYHLEMELSAGSYVLAMTSVGDTEEGMERFVQALYEIDNEIEQNNKLEQDNRIKADDKRKISQNDNEEKKLSNKTGEKEQPNVNNISKSSDACGKEQKVHSYQLPELEQIYQSAEVAKIAKEGNRTISLGYENCEGYISTEFAYLYPPGVPLVVPGERISREVSEILMQYERAGFDIEGTKEEGKLVVLKEITDLNLKKKNMCRM